MSYYKRVTTAYGILGLKDSTQGKTNLEGVQTLLEKVWFSPFNSRVGQN